MVDGFSESAIYPDRDAQPDQADHVCALLGESIRELFLAVAIDGAPHGRDAWPACAREFGRYTQHGAGAALLIAPAAANPYPPPSSRSAKWPVETSGSLRPSPARSASAGTTRRIRASGTIRSDCSCASIAAGADATPPIAKRVERTRSNWSLTTGNAVANGGRVGRSRVRRRSRGWRRPTERTTTRVPIRSSTPRRTWSWPRLTGGWTSKLPTSSRATRARRGRRRAHRGRR